MMTAVSWDTDTLAELTLSHIDADPDALRFSPVRTGKHNASFWVDADRGRLVLRIAPPDDAGFLFYERRMMRQEPELHDRLRAETNLPVAEIVGYDFSRTRIPRDYLLMRALPGAPLSDASGLTRAQRDRALHQVGEQLREIHAITASNTSNGSSPPRYGYLGAHQPMTPQPTWAAAFRVMWHNLLDDVVACGAYTEAEADVFRALLNAHQAHFEHPVTPRLLHMDVWAQNILIDEAGNVTGLVDFDRALWGDVEIEFAVLDYCGISEPAFWRGYGLRRDTSPPAQIRRRFYLLYEIQKYMPIRIWRSRDPQDAERYKAYSFSLARELEAAL